MRKLLGFHVIFSTYGYWLPNDPRGSWSDWIRNWELLRFGPATKVETRESVAGVKHDAESRKLAKKSLAYSEVFLTWPAGFGGRRRFSHRGRGGRLRSTRLLDSCPSTSTWCWGRMRDNIDRIVGHLKARATQQLNRQGIHPLAAYRQADGTTPSPWCRNCWKVFIYSQRHLRDAIRVCGEQSAQGRQAAAELVVCACSMGGERPR